MSAPARARKAPAKPAVPVEDEAPAVGPVRIGSRKLELVDVFELDGTMYRAPKEPSAALVFEYLFQVQRAQRLKSERARNLALIDAGETYVKAIIGPDAWQALGESPLVTAEDVAAVIDKVSKEIAFPAVDKLTGAAGNS